MRMCLIHFFQLTCFQVVYMVLKAEKVITMVTFFLISVATVCAQFFSCFIFFEKKFILFNNLYNFPFFLLDFDHNEMAIAFFDCLPNWGRKYPLLRNLKISVCTSIFSPYYVLPLLPLSLKNS